MSEPVAKPPVQVTALGSGRYGLEDGHRRRVAYATQVARATWVFLEGRVYVVREADDRELTAHGDEETALSAPMPATVVAIEVTKGQHVSRGDVLVRLEAMKMELSIKAPRDGTIAAIGCRAGEFVQPGVQLVELE